MNEDEASRLLSRAADSIPPIPRPAVNRLIQQGKRVQRRQRLISAASVAAVAALIIGAGALWLPGSSGSAKPPAASDETISPDDSGLPTPPPGTRWVGFNGVMVAVPRSWSTNHMHCGLPLSNTVDFFDAGYMDVCGDISSLRYSLLRPVALTSPEGSHWKDVRGEFVDIEGITATLTSLECSQVRLGGCSAALVLPTRDAVFKVGSPDPEEVDVILDTARLIPEGYTAVPDVTGSTNDEEVAGVMRAAGLEWAPRCPVNADCDLPALEATNPQAGTVVPLGTTLQAGDPDDDDEPPANEEPACAVPGTIGHMDLWEPPPPGRTLEEAMQDFMDDMSEAHSYDIASQSDEGAYVAVFDESQTLVATVRLKQWDNGSWTSTDFTTCSTEEPSTDELPGEPPTDADLIGTWRLLPGSGEKELDGEQGVVTFQRSYTWLGWRGYDGLNRTDGRVRLTPAGAFSTYRDATTLIGHIDPKVLRTAAHGFHGENVVTGASQVRISGDQLTFYDDAKKPLGTFVRVD